MKPLFFVFKSFCRPALPAEPKKHGIKEKFFKVLFMPQKKRQVLSRKKDFLLLKKEGQRISRGGFFILYRKNRLSFCRFALFFPKWTGKAVCRNRFRRWTKHFLRQKSFPFPADLLLGFEKREKSFYKTMGYERFCAGFDKIFQRVKSKKTPLNKT